MPSQKAYKIESLNSWKEISLYLDRGVRTVQRWEKELDLPIHRVGRGPRSRVHAFESELRAWLLAMGHIPAGDTHRPGHERGAPHRDGTLAASRVLVNRSSALVKQMVQSMWIQQKRAQELMDVIENVSRRVHGRRTAKSRPPAGLAVESEAELATRLGRVQKSRPGSRTGRRSPGADRGKVRRDPQKRRRN